jgi:hypothetical protein
MCQSLLLSKNTIFPFLSFMFFFYKTGEQEGGTGSAWGHAGRRWGKGWEDEHSANNVNTCI